MDYIFTPRMQYITVDFLGNSVSTKTKEDGDKLIQIANQFTNSICPEGTSPELGQKAENTILFAMSQHTSNMFFKSLHNTNKKMQWLRAK